MTVFEEVLIAGQPAWALVDTGSDFTVLHDAAANLLGVRSLRTVRSTSLLGAGTIPEGLVKTAGVGIEVAGCTKEAEVQIRSRKEFPVLGSTAEVRPGVGRQIALVLGNDVLDRVEVGIQMRLDGHDISAKCGGR